MNLAIPFIDWIWRAKGHIELAEPLSPEEAFERLDPLFQTPGTKIAVEGDTLAYAKHNPNAQDKLATFTRGTLRVEQGAGGSRLSFNVTSTALVLTFLAPLLFLGFAQIAHAINDYEWAQQAAEEAAKEAKGKDKSADKPDEKAKKKAELHPLDKLLGAPEPKDPNAEKNKKKEPKEKIRSTPAYVLAGLFFAIFLVGRFLEPWLLKRTLRKALAQQPEDQMQTPAPAPQGDLANAGGDKPPSALAPHG